MRLTETLGKNRAALRALVVRHRVRNPRVSGSTASGRNTEGIDLDLLVEPTSDTTLFDTALM
jgi:hypothetical protein